MKAIKAINGWAERLHLGVHCQRIQQSTEPPDKYEDDVAESAILLSTTVDALGAVFNILVDALRVARLGHSSRKDKDLLLGKRPAFYGDEACRLLEIAGDELISEATGAAPGDNVGPVVTAEAILITTMERLVRGVFGTGSVDVINVLEECLEQLVSSPSR